MTYPISSYNIKIKKVIKEYPKTFQEVFPPESKIYFSNNKREMNAINIKGGKPITGHEKLNNNPLKIESSNKNNIFKIFGYLSSKSFIFKVVLIKFPIRNIISKYILTKINWNIIHKIDLLN